MKQKPANKKTSLGLGDTIEKFTKTVGLDKVASRLARVAGKEDCGCTRRRDKLNSMFPYSKKK